VRWCDTFAATNAGTLKGKHGKRQAAPRPTLADAAAHERSRESFSTRSAPSKDDLPSGIAHPCRDGA
jgi:hypothetical protein